MLARILRMQYTRSEVCTTINAQHLLQTMNLPSIMDALTPDGSNNRRLLCRRVTVGNSIAFSSGIAVVDGFVAVVDGSWAVVVDGFCWSTVLGRCTVLGPWSTTFEDSAAAVSPGTRRKTQKVTLEAHQLHRHIFDQFNIIQCFGLISVHHRNRTVDHCHRTVHHPNVGRERCRRHRTVNHRNAGRARNAVVDRDSAIKQPSVCLLDPFGMRASVIDGGFIV